MLSIFDDYSYGYGGYGSSSNNALVGLIICLVLAFAGGIVLYCTFLSRKNNGKFTGFLGWLYDTLSFNSLLLEMLMKISYLILAGFITLYSIVLLFTPGAGFLTFLMLLVFGNIVVRIMYEFMLIIVIICRNTSEISKRLGGSGGEGGASFGPAAFRQATPAQPQYQQPMAPQQNAYQQQPPFQAPVQAAPPFQAPAAAQPAPVADQTVFCAECGTKLEPGASFCPNCGAVQK